jgi:multidrug efflux system membrane fusion protein
VAPPPRGDPGHRARDQPQSDAEHPLAHVEPTTDWIRLQRRFRVTLVLRDLPPAIVLQMGADARALIIC